MQRPHHLRPVLPLLLLLPACAGDASMRVRDTNVPIEYPAAARTDVVDDYHGTSVPDPYRWLENPDSEESVAWIEEQNALTRSWIDALPEREAIERRIGELWNYARLSPPAHEGGRWFWTRNDGLQNQSVVLSGATPGRDGTLLLDPNALSKDGTVSLTGASASRDGKLWAYQLAEAGSDWNRVRVRDIASGKDLADVIERVKFSGLAWAPDGSGFYYSTFPDSPDQDRGPGVEALANHTLYFHRLGTKQVEDRVVHARPDQPEWGFHADVTDDGELLVISQTQGTEPKNRVLVQYLAKPDAPIVPLLDAFDAEYELLCKQGHKLWFRTDKDAPRGRIVRVDLEQPYREGDPVLDTIVPEGADTIEFARAAGGKLVVCTLEHGANRLRAYALDGKDLGAIALPGLGSIAAFEGDFDVPEAFFAFTGFATPTEVWRWDAGSGALTRPWAPKVPFDPAEYVCERVFYRSKDGTRVPLYITRRKDVELGPDTPTLLYGYGGFNIPIKPGFSPGVLAWMELGGVYASACLRGGAEYGRPWHEAGTLGRKQNTFDDFVAAAEFLVTQGWTSPAKLAIHGRSNGGLLVGACITQRPELYAAAIPGVGVLDMLRYHQFTIGWAWSSDYGRADDPQAFRYLYAYSPLHALRPGTRYPATLVTTGQHDDRVVPAHSFKFAAELQRCQGGDAPCLIRVETKSGHGAGKPTALQIEELADQWAFLVRALGFAPRLASQEPG